MNELYKFPIPEGFLEAEERDGYFVSAKMKRVWASELDILKVSLRYVINLSLLIG